MRQKIWTASDLQPASSASHGGESVPAATVAGGEAVLAPATKRPEAVVVPAVTAGGEAVLSDLRLKDDIVRIGNTSHGLPLYRFRYKGGRDSFAGVMAQDVLGVMPEAVTVGADGFYRVNYAKLGIALRRL
jgi:endosialidase-like protein